MYGEMNELMGGTDSQMHGVELLSAPEIAGIDGGNIAAPALAVMVLWGIGAAAGVFIGAAMIGAAVYYYENR